MKKLIFIIVLILFVPYLFIKLFVYDNNIKFFFKTDDNIRIKQTSGNIIEVPFEEYIVGVISGEMPVSFELEALKAQAVAARSYALVQVNRNKSNDYDVVDTVMNQVYLDENTLKQKWGNNYDNNINKVRKAVIETKGEYLEYDGKVIEAMFFSTSAGKTENVEEVFSEKLPYLRSVDSSFDKEVSPVFETVTEYVIDDFCAKLGISKTNNIKVENIDTTSTGRIKNIKINDKLFTGSEVAKKLNLRSNFFNINQNGDNIKIVTNGYGHGVGMSQYGALALSKKGYKYDQILKYYYTGVEIKKI